MQAAPDALPFIPRLNEQSIDVGVREVGHGKSHDSIIDLAHPSASISGKHPVYVAWVQNTQVRKAILIDAHPDPTQFRKIRSCSDPNIHFLMASG